MNIPCACVLLTDLSYPMCPQLKEISALGQPVKKLCVDRGKGIRLHHSSLLEFLKLLLCSGGCLFRAFVRLFLYSINPEF